jgi:hypothetical protein
MMALSSRKGLHAAKTEGAHMNKLIALVAGALVTYALVSSWPEIVRYRRMMSM